MILKFDPLDKMTFEELVHALYIYKYIKQNGIDDKIYKYAKKHIKSFNMMELEEK